MAKVFCKHCGYNTTSISGLTSNTCPRHPLGSHKGKHVLYEGAEKSQYECKYCGYKASSISGLTGNTCPRHPNGTHKGKHEPAM